MDDASYRAHLNDVSFERPHVFLLGAGASRAAFPDGDFNGNHLPLMDDLIETLNLGPAFSRQEISWEGINFELLYASLAADARYNDLTAEIEHRVHDYFAHLRLPPWPTLYDHLVLSLRPKDIVATFNWDPFLFDACARNNEQVGYPRTFFLHGNVRVGYCPDDGQAGPIFLHCPKCHTPFRPTRLIFPITKKNYDADPYVSAQWNNLRRALKNGYILTIFGYSAPTSDIEAVKLMQQAWGTPEERNLEEIEIIDIKDRDALRTTWKPFIHTHHFRTYQSWYDSWAADYPRRTCEAMWSTLMENHPLQPASLPANADFSTLWTWLTPFLTAEGRATLGDGER